MRKIEISLNNRLEIKFIKKKGITTIPGNRYTQRRARVYTISLRVKYVVELKVKNHNYDYNV